MREKEVALSVLVVMLSVGMLLSSPSPGLADSDSFRLPSGFVGSLHRSGRAPGGVTDNFGSDPGFHAGATLLCSDCHAAHFSMQHGYDGGAVATTGAPDGNWLPVAGPNPYLLKAANSTELCLACHDGKTFAPDVVEADSAGLVQRSAGRFGALGADNIMGHDLSTNPGGKPGSFDYCMRCHFGGTMATASVQCIDCHNPHGNGSFRNLWWTSDPGNEPPMGAYIRTGVSGLARYEDANVGYPAPVPGDNSYREITNTCIDCHHTFFGSAYTNADSPFIRHPGTNSESGFYAPIDEPGANTDPAAWVAGTFLIPRLKFIVVGATDFNSATTVASDNEVFCLSCHRAHGSTNPFGLRWDYDDATSPTQPAGCRQCHENVVF